MLDYLLSEEALKLRKELRCVVKSIPRQMILHHQRYRTPYFVCQNFIDTRDYSSYTVTVKK
jgi:hypothetical protein